MAQDRSFYERIYEFGLRNSGEGSWLPEQLLGSQEVFRLKKLVSSLIDEPSS
jgi:hypothetical protein